MDAYEGATWNVGQGDTWNVLDAEVIHCYNEGVTWNVGQGGTWNVLDAEVIHCYNEGLTWNVGQGETLHYVKSFSSIQPAYLVVQQIPTNCMIYRKKYFRMSVCQYVNMSVCQYVRMQLFSLGIKMKVVQNFIRMSDSQSHSFKVKQSQCQSVRQTL